MSDDLSIVLSKNTTLVRNVKNIIMEYLTDPPDLPFLKELLYATRWINDTLEIYQYGLLSVVYTRDYTKSLQGNQHRCIRHRVRFNDNYWEVGYR